MSSAKLPITPEDSRSLDKTIADKLELLTKMHAMLDKIANITESKTTLGDHHESLLRETNAIKDQIKDIADLLSKTNASSHEKIIDLQSQLKQKTSDLTDLQNQLQSHKDDAEKYAGELERLRNELQTKTSEYNKLDENFIDLEKEFSKKNKDLKNLTTDYIDLNTKNILKDVTIKSITDENVKLNNKIDECEKLKTELDKKFKQLELDATNSAKTTDQEKDKQIKELTAEKDRLAELNNTLNASLQKLSDEFPAQINYDTSTLTDLQTNVKELIEKNGSLIPKKELIEKNGSLIPTEEFFDAREEQ
jgi:chromosome segregation ATPase